MADTELRALTLPLDLDAALLDLVADEGPLTSWVRLGDGYVGWGEALRIDAGAGAERFERAAIRVQELASRTELDDAVGVPGGGLVGFASFTFDDRSHGSVVVVPRVVVGRRDGAAWMTRIGPPDALPEPVLVGEPAGTHPDRVRYAGSSMPDLHWLEAVAEAIRRIHDDQLGKVVLARDHAVWSRHPFDPRSLARRLSERFPTCFTFVVDRMVGATPELLIRRSGSEIASRALAGTAARGATADEDARLARDLLASDKDRREHAFAARSVRAVLEPLCDPFEADARPHLLELDNVLHLATDVRGRLTSERSVLELVAALHPTAAVGGAPTDRALALIRELEGTDRGRYAGPVGWFTADGEGEFAIALRCAELAGARARLFAGAGIVAGSLPEAELEETRLKLSAMRSAFGGGELGA